jgi:hypothetical protein
MLTPQNWGSYAYEYLQKEIPLSLQHKNILKSINMLKASSADQLIIQEMIAEAVYDNPKVRFQLGPQNFDQKVKWLSWFIYNISMARQSIYLSDDKQAMIIFMRSHEWKKKWSDIPFYFRLFFSAFDWRQILSIIQMEKVLAQYRPQNMDYIYVWVLGAKRESKGKGQAQTLRDSLFQISENLQIPIYAETAFEQNHRVFTRFGFKTYYTRTFPDIPLNIHFMRRNTAPKSA